jgi:hypothetical protein
MRPLFDRSEIVLVFTDDVESRRGGNHLARRANIPLFSHASSRTERSGRSLGLDPGRRNASFAFGNASGRKGV